MLHRSSIALMAMAISTCTSANSADAILEISNTVESCVRFSADQSRSDGPILLLETRVEHLQSTAACGCKSGLLSYRVLEKIGDTGLTGEIVAGRITGMKPFLTDRAVFVVDTDQSVGRRGARSLEIGCTPPD